MFNLIPLSLLIGALGGILYIVSNHLSELNSEEEENDFSGFNFKARLAEYVNQLPLDAIKSQSLAVTKIALHRARLALLKTDNHLIKLISKISQGDKAMHVKTNENDSIPDFWEKVAKPEEQTIAPASEIKLVKKSLKKKKSSK